MLFPVNGTPTLPKRPWKVTDKFPEFAPLLMPPAEEEAPAFLTQKEEEECLAALKEAENQAIEELEAAWRKSTTRKTSKALVFVCVAFAFGLCAGLLVAAFF